MTKVHNNVACKVHNKVHNEVHNDVHDNVHNEVHDNVHDDVHDNVQNNVQDNVRDDVHDTRAKQRAEQKMHVMYHMYRTAYNSRGAQYITQRARKLMHAPCASIRGREKLPSAQSMPASFRIRGREEIATCTKHARQRPQFP